MVVFALLDKKLSKAVWSEFFFSFNRGENFGAVVFLGSTRLQLATWHFPINSNAPDMKNGVSIANNCKFEIKTAKLGLLNLVIVAACKNAIKKVQMIQDKKRTNNQDEKTHF